MRYFAILSICIWVQCAAAQEAPTLTTELPALFEVTGLSNGDVSNMRIAPQPEAKLIGALTLDTAQVEVLERSEDGRWVLVSAGPEQWGWVYFDGTLQPVSLPSERATNFGGPLWCGGSEPFWTLTVDPNFGVVWDFAGDDQTTLELSYASNAINRGRTNQVMTAISEDLEITVMLQQNRCWGTTEIGLSGFRAQVLERRDGVNEFVSGCCSLLAPGK